MRTLTLTTYFAVTKMLQLGYGIQHDGITYKKVNDILVAIYPSGHFDVSPNMGLQYIAYDPTFAMPTVEVSDEFDEAVLLG